MTERKLNQLAQNIVDFEEKHHLTDTEMGLASGFTVERLHGLKAMETTATQAEQHQLQQFIQQNANKEEILAH